MILSWAMARRAVLECHSPLRGAGTVNTHAGSPPDCRYSLQPQAARYLCHAALSRSLSSMPRVLYQFPISHYCEKARWVLDYKRLPYRIHNQMPGPHALPNTWRTGKRTVPLLVDGETAISGSHAIALYLEAQPGAPSLLPPSAAGRAQLEELAHYFDEEVAPAVRRYAYGFILPRTELFHEVFFREYPPLGRKLAGLIAKPLSRQIARMYRVHTKQQESLDRMRAGADRVEAMLKGGARYLIDDRL